VNGDSVVNSADVNLIVNNYQTANANYDVNNDGRVNIFDLSVVLTHFGQTVPSSSVAPDLFPAPTPRQGTDWWVAPGASITADGHDPAHPIDFQTALNNVSAGQTVWVEDGTYSVQGSASGANGYVLRRSGADGNLIRIRAVNPRKPVIQYIAGSSTRQYNGSVIYVDTDVHHVSVEYLSIDGDAKPGSGHYGAGQGISFNTQDHHVRAIGNDIRYTSSVGIGAHHTDYATIYGNYIWECGNYGVGPTGGSWGSTITYHQPDFNYDPNDHGFHSVIAENIGAGEVDTSTHHSDGNGIILDNPNSVATPPILVANNIMYMNGGRGIHPYNYNHAWIINNTTYVNGLDTRVAQPYGPMEYGGHSGLNDLHYINNISYGWGIHSNYQFDGGYSNFVFASNTRYLGGGDRGIIASTESDPSQIKEINPQFFGAPNVPANGNNLWLTAPDPLTIGSAFSLAPGSPLINAGVDPRSTAGVTTEMVGTMNTYLLRDFSNNLRPIGAGWDIGAYEK
jgi:hypothetical protein